MLPLNHFYVLFDVNDWHGRHSVKGISFVCSVYVLKGGFFFSFYFGYLIYLFHIEFRLLRHIIVILFLDYFYLSKIKSVFLENSPNLIVFAYNVCLINKNKFVDIKINQSFEDLSMLLLILINHNTSVINMHLNIVRENEFTLF